MNIFRSLGRAVASFVDGMNSIFDSRPSHKIDDVFSDIGFRSYRTITRTASDGTQTVQKYEDMTPEEQRAFDKTFEDMDASFDKMGADMDAAFKDFDKKMDEAFDTPFFRGRRR